MDAESSFSPSEVSNKLLNECLRRQDFFSSFVFPSSYDGEGELIRRLVYSCSKGAFLLYFITGWSLATEKSGQMEVVACHETKFALFLHLPEHRIFSSEPQHDLIKSQTDGLMREVSRSG